MKVSAPTRLFLALALGFVGVAMVFASLFSAWGMVSGQDYYLGWFGYLSVFLGLLVGVGFLSAFFDAWAWFRLAKKPDLRLPIAAIALVVLVSVAAAGYNYYLSMQTYSFTAKVVDKQGNAMYGVEVRLTRNFFEGNESPVPPSSVTGTDGVAVFKGLKQGTYYPSFTDSVSGYAYTEAYDPVYHYSELSIPQESSGTFTLEPLVDYGVPTSYPTEFPSTG